MYFSGDDIIEIVVGQRGKNAFEGSRGGGGGGGGTFVYRYNFLYAAAGGAGGQFREHAAKCQVCQSAILVPFVPICVISIIFLDLCMFYKILRRFVLKCIKSSSNKARSIVFTDGKTLS